MDKFIQFPGPEVFIKLDLIQPDASAEWGIMTAQHMLEHLLLPLQFSRGQFEVPLVTPLDRVEKVKRIMLLSEAPLKRDFVAPFIGPGLQTLVHPDFTSAKNTLIEEIHQFLHFWDQNPEAGFTHPIFGFLNRDEWYLFHRKHFTHHFSQFGVR